MVPLRELIALLGLPRFSLARLALAFGLLIVAIGLGIAGFVRLLDALYLSLLPWMGPAGATLLVGLLLLALALCLCLVARRLTRPLPPSTRPSRPPSGAGDVAAAQALAWIQQHPGQSAVLAAVLGFCAGASPEARRAMSDLAKPKS